MLLVFLVSLISVWSVCCVIVLTIFMGLRFAALECFSVGDGLLWEDAWFYAASDFLMDFFPPLFVMEIDVACNLNGPVLIATKSSLWWTEGQTYHYIIDFLFFIIVDL